MNFRENFRVALRALAANKLRSILTMLGIIIGVGAVVALMALGNGATASITAQVQGIGSNLVIVFPGGLQRRPDEKSISVLYLSDYQELAKNLKNIVSIAPTFVGGGLSTTYGNQRVETTITATTAEYGKVVKSDIEFGRFLTDNDRATKARVAVIGSRTSQNLFGGLNPVGRIIKINSIPFKVVGLLKSQGASGFNNRDDTIIVPLETGYEKLFGSLATFNGRRQVNSIYMSAASAEVVNDVMVQTERLLRRTHGLKLTDKLDFSVLSQAAFLSALNTITATLTVFLGAIAGISLLVGGIGIMNIMLVSVTERTKEIGLRKAVGAKRRAILMQFLIETLVLSLIGGLIGISLGWLVAAAVTAAKLMTAKVTLDSVLLAFFFAAAVGIFFGLYPAYRASRLSPIEALRYE
jgi:putative ABC transport system permease protein